MTTSQLTRRLYPALAAQLGLLSALLWTATTHAADPPSGASTPTVSAATLAVIVNDDDPQSVEIARYYQQRRDIPPANMIHVRFAPGGAVMPRAVFENLKREVDRRTPPSVQAYALTWAAPYRVDCMSITTAFAAGFDPRFCASGCGTTLPAPYFNSDSRTPYTDFQLRPTMALAGTSVGQIKRLIDRSVASDASHPSGTAYLVRSGDHPRNVRAALYPTIAASLQDHLAVKIVDADNMKHRTDVLFYFTGAAQVQALETLRFVPGAIADHLTSAGGQLTDSQQMSALRWIEAGATGSYGAVVEPCNLTSKFPSPGVVIRHYLRGNTLIEAYWKSVAMPGQGIFVGEPLAAPFRAQTARPATD